MSIFWFLAVTIPYLAVIAYLGLKGFQDTKNSADYLVGGRNVHPYVMAISYGATFISTAAIVGFGGIASLFGLSLLWLPALNILVGIIIAFVFFGKKTRSFGLKLGAHTFPEFLARRVDSKFIQVFAGSIIFLIMPLYAAAVLIGASRILEGLLGIPYLYSVAIFSLIVAAYVIMGGLKGVMYTDALQGTLMFAGMLFLLVFIYVRLGGVINAHQALTDMASMVPENLVKIGHRGWTANPAAFSPLWWVIFSSLVLGVGIGVLAQPQLVVRFMTVRSNMELNRAVFIGSLFIFVTTVTAYIVGALSNVFFFETTGKISIAAAGGNADKVIPLFISSTLPSWFGYLFMLVILSAAMSTLSSQFHAIGTSIGRDIYQKGLAKNAKREHEILITRVGIVISILFTVFLSINMGASIIARATAIFFGFMASGFLAPYIASLYWKGLSRKGAIAGSVSGVAVSMFGFLFLHEKEATVFGLCKLLTGNDVLFSGTMASVDPMVFSLPVSIICTIVVSMLTKVENEETVKMLFEE